MTATRRSALRVFAASIGGLRVFAANRAVREPSHASSSTAAIAPVLSTSLTALRVFAASIALCVTAATSCILAACGGGARVVPVAVARSVVVVDARPMLAVAVGDATYLFEPKRLLIRRGEQVVVTAPAPESEWRAAAAIAALDGEGRWVVAADGDGALWRVRLDGEREAIGDRFGFTAADHVREVAGSGHTIAFVLDRAIAYTRDGVHLARIAIDPRAAVQDSIDGDRIALAVRRHSLAVAGERLAFTLDQRVEVWNLTAQTRVHYSIDGEPHFLDGRLTISAQGAVYVERGDELVRIDLPARLASFAAAANRSWLIAGTEHPHLYMFEHDHITPTDVTPDRGGVLFGMPDGSVWFSQPLAHQTSVIRYSPDAPAGDPAWTAQVRPVFERVCAHCHLPGGSADVDLSTASAWATERDEIARRVLVTHTMPPAGTALSDADREALASWLHARPRAE